VCFCCVNVPIAINETVPPVGTLPGSIVVLVAAALGVKVAVLVGVRLGVFVGFEVLDDVAVAVAEAVGEGGISITIALIAKPGVALAVAVPLLLPPPQLNRIAPKTNNRTGVTTSHLSHRDNMKSSPMTDARERCQGDARFGRANAVAKASPYSLKKESETYPKSRSAIH
jgi:hypothetical protein